MRSEFSQVILRSTRRSALICSGAVLAALGGSNPARADPGMTNLAIGGTATSTRADFGGTPEKGNDGNRNGNFGDGSVFYENADSTPGATSYYYQVDLRQNSDGNPLQVLPRTDAGQK